MREIITRNNFSEEIHPWDWHIPKEANKLLIGTFPTNVRNRKEDFFYCSATNRFWEVLSAVSGHSLDLSNGGNAIEERKNILDKLKLGLTDMGKVIHRQQGSSKDHSLFPIEFMNIIQMLHEYPAITTLIVSGNLQGNSSLSWFSIFCSFNNIKFNGRELKNRKSTDIYMADRNVKVLLCYSPSRLSRITTEKLIDSYNSLIGTNHVTIKISNEGT